MEKPKGKIQFSGADVIEEMGVIANAPRYQSSASRPHDHLSCSSFPEIKEANGAEVRKEIGTKHGGERVKASQPWICVLDSLEQPVKAESEQEEVIRAQRISGQTAYCRGAIE